MLIPATPTSSRTRGRVLSPRAVRNPLEDEVDELPDRHKIASARDMRIFPVGEITPPPYPNRARYDVVWRPPSGRVFVGLRLLSPTMPPPPDVNGPIGCACEDAEGNTLRYGGAQLDARAWGPNWFEVGSVRPYTPDVTHGYGPCAARAARGLLVQWSPSWCEPKDDSTWTYSSEILQRLGEFDAVDREVADLLLVKTDNTPCTVEASSGPDLWYAWGSWVHGVVKRRATILECLVGRGMWRQFEEVQPVLARRMELCDYFNFGAVGAWFARPDLHWGDIQLFLQNGVPVLYEWTADLAASEVGPELRPLDEDEAGSAPAATPDAKGNRVRALARAPSSPVKQFAQPPDNIERRKKSVLFTAEDSLGRALKGSQGRSPTASPAPTLRDDSPEPRVRSARPLVARISSPPADTVPYADTSFPPEELVELPPWVAYEDMLPLDGATTPLLDRIAPPYVPPVIKLHVLEESLLYVSGFLKIQEALVFAYDDYDVMRVGLPVQRRVLEFVPSSRGDHTRLVVHDVGRALATAQDAVATGTAKTWKEFFSFVLARGMRITAGIKPVHVDVSIVEDRHTLSSAMELNSRWDAETAWAKWHHLATVLLTKSHVMRASLLSGGILWRLARFIVDEPSVYSRPFTDTCAHGGRYPVKIGLAAIHDDWLTEPEERLLVGGEFGGPAVVEAANAKYMWPPPAVWEHYAGGVWGEAQERWFLLRVQELKGGHSPKRVFLSRHGWIGTLRGWHAAFGV